MSKILIADDAPFFRMMLKDVLEKEGHEILLAKDGLETIEIAQEQGDQLDLIIIDMVMPRKTGVEVLMDLEEFNFNILCVTGNEMIGEGKDLLELGSKGFINKSTPVEEILYEVNKILFDNKKTETPRASERVRVKLQIQIRTQNQAFTSKTFTLSETGLFVQGDPILPKGTEVQISFFVPIENSVGKEIECKGNIVWSEAEPKPGQVKGMGIQFQDINPFDLQVIKDFIDSQKQN